MTIRPVDPKKEFGAVANSAEREWTQDEIDEQAFVDDDEDVGEDCGRWSNGRLTPYCSKAGSEECDWECPIGLPRPARSRVLP